MSTEQSQEEYSNWFEELDSGERERITQVLYDNIHSPVIAVLKEAYGYQKRFLETELNNISAMLPADIRHMWKDIIEGKIKQLDSNIMDLDEEVLHATLDSITAEREMLDNIKKKERREIKEIKEADELNEKEGYIPGEDD